MLKQLRLKNFRQHRELTVDFTAGLNVVRGANENGKTTILEAIGYAFFGISACRTSLAEMVTWGEKESALKVELDFEVEKIDYTIKRGKSGAEVNWKGGKVVGQTEVGAFVGRLFGISSKNVNRLIISGQGNIRGALSEGSTKTAELIEQLANFSIIDEVIELIAANLTTGATAPFEQKAAALLVELEELQAALAEPDTAADEARLAELEATVDAVEDAANEILEQIEPLTARRDALRARAAEKGRLEERVRLLAEQVSVAQRRLAEHEAQQPVAPDAARAQALAQALADARRTEERLKGRLAVEQTTYPEENFWEGDMASFEAEVARCRGALKGLRERLAAGQADLRVKRAELVAAGTCGFCGQDFSRLPASIEKNDRLTREIAALEADVGGVRAVIAEEEATERALEAVRRDHQRIQAALARLGDDVRWETSVVPHRPRWAFNTMVGLADTAAAQAELDGLRAQERACAAWETTRNVLSEACGRAQAERRAAEGKLTAGFPGIEELAELESRCDKLNSDYAALYSSLVQTQTEAAEITARVSSAKAAYAAAVARVEQVRAQKREAEELVEQINFNNALKKRVQQARPIIANKLWSMVLTAVSRYFSQMRGTDSVVSKDADGFKVDGKGIESLSGSTLDILGLAIRLALVRTFLPHTPLLILDEPSAACDTARTEAMMGFLVSCGFDQLLLVTHEDTSEKVAENLIAI